MSGCSNVEQDTWVGRNWLSDISYKATAKVYQIHCKDDQGGFQHAEENERLRMCTCQTSGHAELFKVKG